jgi:hypothetical protein
MKNLYRWILAGFVLSGSACADLPSVPSTAHPVPHRPAFNTEAWGGGGGGTEYPVFASEADARDAMGDSRIHWALPSVDFKGNTAWASAGMSYDGNWAEMRMSLSARNSRGGETAKGAPQEQSFWAVYGKIFSAPQPIQAPLLGPACGGYATTTTEFHVKHLFVLEDTKYIPSLLDQKVLPASRTIRQADCPPEPCPAAYTGGDGTQWMSSWLGNAWDCEQEKDEPSGKGGGNGPCAECIEEPAAPTYCRVRYSWWKDTGEIFRWTVLWCA